MRPSEYMPQIFADAVVFAPDVLDLCVKVFGADNVLYGSDYPHTIGDMPGCLKRVNGLPDAARDKVRGATRAAYSLSEGKRSIRGSVVAGRSRWGAEQIQREPVPTPRCRVRESP